MNPRNIFMIFAVAWVGGWGFVMFRYPELFAKINARFGLKIGTSPRFIAFTRRMGIVEMALAVLSVISTVIMHVVGVRGY
jgi:hypothetical protein